MSRHGKLSLVDFAGCMLFIERWGSAWDDSDEVVPVVLTVVQAGGESHVKLAVRDLAVLAKQFTFVKNKKPDCQVRAVTGKVELKQGDCSVTAKSISTKFQNGILSKNTSPNRVAELLFQMATGQIRKGE